MAAHPELPSSLTGTLINRYDILKKLGEGGYGQIYKVLDKRRGEVKAVKFVSATSDTTNNELEALEALQEVAGNGLCPLLDTFLIADLRVFVFPLMSGDLFSLRDYNKNNCLGKKTCLKICWMMVNALEVMHNCFYLHRDINTRNIMLQLDSKSNKLGKVVLIDFGLATKFNDGNMRFAECDFAFEESLTSSYRMATHQPSAESEDLKMLAYTLLLCRNINPLGDNKDIWILKRENLEINPKRALKGVERHRVLLPMIYALVKQTYGKAPDYERVRRVIREQGGRLFNPNGPLKVIHGRGYIHLQ